MTTLQDRPHTALLVVDVQVGVVEGAHQRDAVVANIGTLVERARQERVPVVWVQHSDEYLARGSDEWKIVPELAPADAEPVIEKNFGDSFEDTDLETVLSDLGVGRLIVAGAQTDACIRSTLHGALSGDMTPHLSPTPTRPRTRPNGGHRHRIKSSRTPTCTGDTKRHPAGRPARSNQGCRLRLHLLTPTAGGREGLGWAATTAGSGPLQEHPRQPFGAISV